MRLREACNIGLACGLETLGEAVMNIQIHAMNIFTYDEMVKEINELVNECTNYDSNSKILDVFPELDEVQNYEM